ncbi:MAG: lipocalin family protein [Akkermansia sp.]|nr:lipocalin family protein [Akkermansia sp.]
MIQQFLNSGGGIPFTFFMDLRSITHYFSKRPVAECVDITPVQDISLTRYMGRWYEQARLENWFERDMSEVCTDYRLNPDGSIDIINAGRTKHGRHKKSHGKGICETTGVLQVSFVPPYCWFRSPYHILYLADDYSAALVSGAGAGYLWFLTRARRADTCTLKELAKEARRRGFDTDQLRPTWQMA